MTITKKSKMTTTKKYFTDRLNPHNKFVTPADLEQVFENLGFPLKVNDIKVYQQAFVHRSYIKNSMYEPPCKGVQVPFQDESNETYEFLGDTILGSSVGTYLYEKYQHENEGFLTKTRTKMVRGTTLGELARRLGFGQWLIISSHVEAENGRENLRILEDLFESFIAAIYLDNGSEPISAEWLRANENRSKIQRKIEDLEASENLNVGEYVRLNQEYRKLTSVVDSSRSNGYLYAQKFIRLVFDRYVNIDKLAQFNDNYKELLQTHYQRINGMFPKWELLKEEGKTNNRLFTIGIRDRCGFMLGKGTEKKKADAEQLASKNALVYMGIIDSDENEYSFFIN